MVLYHAMHILNVDVKYAEKTGEFITKDAG